MANLSIPNTFAALTTANTGNLDADFTAVANFVNNPLNRGNYVADTGTANAYIVNPTPALTNLNAGQLIAWTPSNTNTTTAATVNFSSLGALSLKVIQGTGLVGPPVGSIQSGVALLSMTQGSGADVIILTPGLPATATPGGWVQIGASQTASASASIVFTSGIDSTYDQYKVVVSGLTASTSSAMVEMRISQDGGSTYKSGGTDYVYTNWFSNSAGTSGVGSTSTGAAQIVLNTGANNTAGHGLDYNITFDHPSSSSLNKTFTFDAGGILNDGNLYRITGCGSYVTDTNAINAIEFIMSVGNIATGNFYLYGLVKS